MATYQSLDLSGVLVGPQTFVGSAWDPGLGVSPGETVHLLYPAGDRGPGSEAIRLHPAGELTVALAEPLAGIKLRLDSDLEWLLIKAVLDAEVAADGFSRERFDQRIHHADGRVEIIWTVSLSRSRLACEGRLRRAPASHRPYGCW
jgi:hypothetical protein